MKSFQLVDKSVATKFVTESAARTYAYALGFLDDQLEIEALPEDDTTFRVKKKD